MLQCFLLSHLRIQPLIQRDYVRCFTRQQDQDDLLDIRLCPAPDWLVFEHKSVDSDDKRTRSDLC